MAAHDGVAWVAGDPTTSRIELATGDVTEVDLDEHFGSADDTSGFHVAVSSEAVFVVPVNGTVVRIDPETLDTEKVADLEWNVAGALSDGGAVWVLQSTPDADILLWTLDGATGEPQGDPVAVGRYGAQHFAQHEGMVWVVQSGLDKGTAEVRAYEGGAGDPVVSVEVPGRRRGDRGRRRLRGGRVGGGPGDVGRARCRRRPGGSLDDDRSRLPVPDRARLAPPRGPRAPYNRGSAGVAQW
jgi:hypothetical protein